MSINTINHADHPIDPEIGAQIMRTIDEVERRHDVHILYACESGSRGWGFASPDSDYDVRFVYVHKTDWYLTVFPARDVIEIPIDAVYDVSGWELRKALGLLRQGNATLVEWLSSPVVYRQNRAFITAIRNALPQVYRPERAFHHYLHMARKNYRQHLQGETVRLKKYLYVLRPLLACLWIEQGRGPVPMAFQQLVDPLVFDDDLLAAISALLIIKRQAKESENAPAMPVINRFIEDQLARLALAASPVDAQAYNFSVLDRLLNETVLHSDRDGRT